MHHLLIIYIFAAILSLFVSYSQVNIFALANLAHITLINL